MIATCIHSVATVSIGSDDLLRKRRKLETPFKVAGGESHPAIQTLYGQLALDSDRNEMIFDDILQALDAGRSPLVLTERRDHLDYFAKRLNRMARNVIVLRGGMRTKPRRAAMDQLLSDHPKAAINDHLKSGH